MLSRLEAKVKFDIMHIKQSNHRFEQDIIIQRRKADTHFYNSNKYAITLIMNCNFSL